MEFTIEFYETNSGRCPVREFLDELKESNSHDFAAVMAGLAKLRNRSYHRPPLSKPIGDDLFELRHTGKLNTRVLYFFMKGQRIILVHGIRKKTRALLVRDRLVALE
ncbi:MAG TPA: type II toxin-antitoxin system RelE/ParE family toxin, partial [Desulfatiglandales bacterium]|nr:type II toxin-antitoxin system RelE/ParE family toxin [Desulfatiglandales bacterium]